jgi:hypothetical protein
MWIIRPLHNIIVFYLLQGSYGIVKLAYNEEDDTHYVSISTTETKFTYSESDFMKICIYLFMYLFRLLVRIHAGF